MKKITILISVIILGFVQNVKAQEADTSIVYKWFQVQEKASFGDGDAAIDEYIRENFKIPDVAYEKAKSGTVIVSFVIEKDGSLSNIRTTNQTKLGFGVEEAAIDLFKKMPKWTPAIQNDKPCRMEFSKPIRLKFN